MVQFYDRQKHIVVNIVDSNIERMEFVVDAEEIRVLMTNNREYTIKKSITGDKAFDEILDMYFR